jgi:hypothetical protein
MKTEGSLRDKDRVRDLEKNTAIAKIVNKVKEPLMKTEEKVKIVRDKKLYEFLS